MGGHTARRLIIVVMVVVPMMPVPPVMMVVVMMMTVRQIPHAFQIRTALIGLERRKRQPEQNHGQC